MKVTLIPAFNDNYLFSIEDGGAAMVVDPGSAPEVLAHLKRTGLRLERILVTHHHGDHIGGVAELQRETGADVYGPSSMTNYGIVCDRIMAEGEGFAFRSLDFKVLAVPGHTLDHLAYYEETHRALFCGDTLFSLGCGRLFEGTFEQMFTTLAKLKQLPEDTKVYCAHEYTLNNLRFSQKYLQDTGAAKQLQQKYATLYEKLSAQRERNIPTVPSTLAFEREFNLFFNAPSVERFTDVRVARNSF
jgi:hydroxyacylglutathione hydrolase